jgi:PAS domain S-box-containing protein
VVIFIFDGEQHAKLESSLVDTARTLSLALDHEIEASMRSLQVLAASEHLQSGDLKKFYRQAAGVIKTQRSWDTVALSDESGQQLLTLRRPFAAPPLPGTSNNPERLRVFETAQPAVSNLFIGRITEAPLVSVTVPVFRNGKVKYALAAPIYPRSLLQFVSQRIVPADWTATIIDRNATVIARTVNFEDSVGKTATPLFSGKSNNETEGMWRDVSREGIAEYRGFHRSQLSGWSVAVGIPVSVAGAPFRRSLATLAVGSFLLLLLGVALAFRMAHRISRSIAALSESATALGRGEIPRSPASSIPEVNELAQALEKSAVERRRAEADLREARARTESVLESVADIHILFDHRWRYIYVNEAAVRAIGRRREDILGRTLWEIYPDIVGTELDRQYRRAMAERVPVAFDFHYPASDTWWENRFYPAPEGLSVFATNVTKRKQAERELLESRERLRALAAYLQSVREEERTRIARELHDEIGQALTGIKLSLVTSMRGQAEHVKCGVAEVLALSNDLIGKVRDLSLDLRPAMLDDLGLLAALRWHFDRYTAQTDIKVDFGQNGLEGRRFDRELETAAYRIVQEALTNVARHAKVSVVEVFVSADESSLRLRIKDRGAGFEPDSLSFNASVGLSGMRERANRLGGWLKVESVPATGTLLSAELPLEVQGPGNRHPAVGYWERPRTREVVKGNDENHGS